MTSWSKVLVIGVFVAGGGLALAHVLRSTGAPSAPTIIVKVPDDLRPQALAGKVAFDAQCAQCHGKNASGTDRGPPFINRIYNPGHHSDQTFLLAAKIGVRSHHWNYGDMPPQPQVDQQQLADIIAYVRALQEANGIVYQPHRM